MSSAHKGPRGRYYTPRPITIGPRIEKGNRGLSFDVYIGSMEDLVACGFGEAAMYPGQPGVGSVRAAYRPDGSERGRKLKRSYRGESEYVGWHLTPGYLEIVRKVDGRFAVKVTVSYDEQDARARALRRERNRCDSTKPASGGKTSGPEEALRAMPKCADDFRAQLARELQHFLTFVVEMRSKPSDRHGYRLARSAIEEIKEGFDAVVEAISDADVIFDAARHAGIVQTYRAARAAADEDFMGKLSNLVRPNAPLLDGAEP